MPTSPADLLALTAAVAALAQLAAARWRDLGPAPVTLAACSALLGAPSPAAAGALTVAALLAAAAWARGAAHGVGRVDAVGLVAATGAVAGLAPRWLPAAWPGAPEVGPPVLVPVVVLVGLVATGLAVERPGPRRLRVWHHREIPIAARHPGGADRPVRDEADPPASSAL